MGWIIVDHDSQVLAAHAALLPNGRILMFSGSEYSGSAHLAGEIDHTRLYDCFTARVLPAGSPVRDLFCCGHSLLADGSLLAAGGTAEYAAKTDLPHSEHWPGLRNTWTYDVHSSKWIDRAALLPQ